MIVLAGMLLGCAVGEIGVGGGIVAVDDGVGTGAELDLAARGELSCEVLPFLTGELQVHAVPGRSQESGSVSVRTSVLSAPLLFGARWPRDSQLSLVGALGPELQWERTATAVAESETATSAFSATLHGQLGARLEIGAMSLRWVLLGRIDERQPLGTLVFLNLLL
ncbi:MAG: hypothetical protein AAFY60_00950 [Myxococcota bacterium]